MVCCVLFLVCFKASSDYNLSLFRQGHGVPELQLLQSILMLTSELFVGSIYPTFESSWGFPPPPLLEIYLELHIPISSSSYLTSI